MNTQPREDPFVQQLTEQLDRLAERAGTPDAATDQDGTPTDERLAADGDLTPDLTPGPVPAHDQASTDDDRATTDDDLVSAVLAQLRAPSTWTEPPADLKTSVLARVLAQPIAQPSAASEPSGPEGDVSPPAPVAPEPVASPPAETGPSVSEAAEAGPAAPDADVRSLELARRRRRRRWAAIPLAAAAAVVFTFSVLAVERALEPGPARGTTYAASGTALAPQAGAKVSVASAAAGFSIVIDAHNLPAAAPGSYYAAWLTGPRGTVPIGSLHARKLGRPITMWSGVDPAAYPNFTLTLQREGEPTTGPSRLVVLKATLTRP